MIGGPPRRNSFQDVNSQGQHSIPKLEEFRKLQMRFGVHQIIPEGPNEWVCRHPGLSIITDIRYRNLEGLRPQLNTDRSLVIEHYIPQINHFSVFETVRQMGFKRKILTLYKLNKEEDDDEKIEKFLRDSKANAVTVHVDKIGKGTLLDRLKETNAFVYVHQKEFRVHIATHYDPHR
jgi:hypothetical protein